MQGKASDPLCRWENWVKGVSDLPKWVSDRAEWTSPEPGSHLPAHLLRGLPGSIPPAQVHTPRWAACRGRHACNLSPTRPNVTGSKKRMISSSRWSSFWRCLMKTTVEILCLVSNLDCLWLWKHENENLKSTPDTPSATTTIFSFTQSSQAWLARQWGSSPFRASVRPSRRMLLTSGLQNGDGRNEDGQRQARGEVVNKWYVWLQITEI